MNTKPKFLSATASVDERANGVCRIRAKSMRSKL